METDGLVTIKQAAEILGVQRRAIEIALQRGLLASVEVLGRRAIPKTALEEYQKLHPRGRPKKHSPDTENIVHKANLSDEA